MLRRLLCWAGYVACVGGFYALNGAPCADLEQARAYKAQGNYVQAIVNFEACSREEKDNDTSFVCSLMIGECYEGMGDLNRALSSYHQALMWNPQRAEAYHRIARIYRYQSKNQEAYNCIQQGVLCQTKDPALLASYQLDEECSIVAYYTAGRGDGFRAVDALLLGKDVPAGVKANALSNSHFYIENLRGLSLRPIEVALPLIQEGEDERYHPMNTSILKTDSGYTAILRAVNYTADKAGYQHVAHGEQRLKTKNFLLSLDADLRLLSQQEIVEALLRPRTPTHIEGLEDCRLFQHNGDLWFSCTTCDTAPSGAGQIALGALTLGPRNPGAPVFVNHLSPLEGPSPGRWEKNWLPLSVDGRLLMIYNYAPFKVFEVEPETGRMTVFAEYELPYDFSRFRGSAPPIPFDGGYLMLVHETSTRWNNLVYTHRFVWLDESLRIAKVTLPFRFLIEGVEFCLGLTMDPTEHQLILGLSVEDQQAYWGNVDADTVRAMLHPL